MTIRLPRWAASTSRASRWVIMAATSLRQQDGPGAALVPGLAVGVGQVRGAVALVQQGVRDLPGAQDRLGENRAVVGGLPFLVRQPAADADGQEGWQAQVGANVAQRVAPL